MITKKPLPINDVRSVFRLTSSRLKKLDRLVNIIFQEYLPEYPQIGDGMLAIHGIAEDYELNQNELYYLVSRTSYLLGHYHTLIDEVQPIKEKQ